MAVGSFPSLGFVYTGLAQAYAFVFRQSAVDVFADVFGDVFGQAFAVGFDGQQFGTAKAVLVQIGT